MPKRPSSIDAAPGHDDVPELEDVVAVPAPSEPVPLPNLDLFADSGIDVDALRDALAARLAEEIDASLNALRAEFDGTLERIEARLRERLPEMLDDVLGDAAGRRR